MDIGQEIKYTFDLLASELLKTQSSKRVNNTEIVVRCPFCGDSHNIKHAHCYVGFKEEDGVVLYFCHKCPATSRVTPDFLHKMGIFNDELDNYFSKKINKYGRSINKIIKNNLISIPNYVLPKRIKPEDEKKAKYFEKRTGIRVNNEAIENYNLIINLKDFLNENNIPLCRYTDEKQYVINELSKNFLGFLSNNKSMIAFRAVNGTSFTKNKFNFVIDDNYKQSFYYIPKTTIDLLTLRPKIVLAEGTFDIIRVKKQFFPSDSTDAIFASVGGKAGYKKILKELISMTGFLNPEIIFFSDRDVSFDTYTKNILGPFYGLLHGAVYYNLKGKDWGEAHDDVDFQIFKF